VQHGCLRLRAGSARGYHALAEVPLAGTVQVGVVSFSRLLLLFLFHSGDAVVAGALLLFPEARAVGGLPLSVFAVLLGIVWKW